MRKLGLILSTSLALMALPQASAPRLVLPAPFSTRIGQPSPQWVKKETPLDVVNGWKETGRTNGEFCRYSSGSAQIDVDLQKYRDPSSAYEAYTAYINPRMHPSTLNRTSAVDGERLFVLMGSFILELRPT